MSSGFSINSIDSKNIFVLVIGRIKLIIITASHALEIRPKAKNGANIGVVNIGVIIMVRIKILLTHSP